jgi:hypothetical protein
MSGMKSLEAALAEDAERRRTAEDEKKAKDEARRAAVQLAESVRNKFNELSPIMRAAAEELRPMLSANGMTISFPTVHTYGDTVERFSFAVNRGQRIEAQAAAVFWKDGNVTFDDAGDPMRYDDAALNMEYFRERFAQTIAKRLSSQS